jgi:type VI secretion system protein ImpB
MSNTQQKLSRVRPPRVQITYDVETGGASLSKELPLVIGVLADLAGHPEVAPPRFKDRQFVQIDADNFDEVLASTAPHLRVVVPNRLQEGGHMLSAELRFKSIEDFDPASVVRQVEPLQRLLEARGRLVDLLAKLDGNEDLNNALQAALKDGAGLEGIKTALQEPSR